MVLDWRVGRIMFDVIELCWLDLRMGKMVGMMCWMKCLSSCWLFLFSLILNWLVLVEWLCEKLKKFMLRVFFGNDFLWCLCWVCFGYLGLMGFWESIVFGGGGVWYVLKVEMCDFWRVGILLINICFLVFMLILYGE